MRFSICLAGTALMITALSVSAVLATPAIAASI
jgi:hypothetical protein